MKAWIVVCILGFAGMAQAVESRKIEKIDSEKVQVHIITEEPDGVQAAMYVDGDEIETFIQMLLLDSSSRLAQVRDHLEQEICAPAAVRYGGWIEDCGAVELTPAVQTSFARAGWMSAGAQYTFFVGFRHAGSGRMFDVSYMVTIREDVEAELAPEGIRGSILKKTLSLDKVTEIPGLIRILPIR